MTDDPSSQPKRPRKKDRATPRDPDLVGGHGRPPGGRRGAGHRGAVRRAGAGDRGAAEATAALTRPTHPPRPRHAAPAEATAAPAATPTTLRLERGGIGEATATNVEVRLGGIGALGAEDVFVEWGGVGAARADRVGVEFGSVGASLAGELRVTQGFAGAVAAREATIEQSFVRTLIAQRVTVNRPSAALVVIAQQVSGDIRPVLDWRGALVAGAAFGLASALVRGDSGGGARVSPRGACVRTAAGGRPSRGPPPFVRPCAPGGSRRPRPAVPGARSRPSR